MRNNETSKFHRYIPYKPSNDVIRSVFLYRASVKTVGGVKWGYINGKGVLTLPSIYDHAGDFQDSFLAIVRLMDRDGLIDTNGYFIVKPKYETIHPFSEGRATFINRDRYYVMDESGKIITEKDYQYISDYKEGRAIAARNDNTGNYLYGYLNRWGREIIPLEYESATEFNTGKAIVKVKNGPFTLITLTGKVLHTYPFAHVGNYSEGLMAYQQEKNGKFGYLNEQGHVVIDPQFIFAEPFVEGKAIVNISDDFKNKYGLIDSKGNFIIKPIYESIISLGEKRVAVGKAIKPEQPFLGKKYALADTDGNMITGFIYNSIGSFENGLATATNNLYTFFIDDKGKRAGSFPAVSGSGVLQVERSLVRGEIDFRLFYFDKKGQLIWRQNESIPLSGRYSVREKKYKPNKDYLVYYPQIDGIENDRVRDRVNQRLKNLAGVKEISAQEQLDSNFTGDYEVTFFEKQLAVIEINGYNYPFGAAHGMPMKKYSHIDLVTGDFFQLKDLFKPGSNYVKAISDIIVDQIKSDEKHFYVFPGSYKGIQPDQPFFISEGTLNIYYQPYEIAPYMAGFPTFHIRFEELADIIDRSGRFWNSFH